MEGGVRGTEPISVRIELNVGHPAGVRESTGYVGRNPHVGTGHRTLVPLPKG